MRSELCELCKYYKEDICLRDISDLNICLNTEDTQFKPRPDTRIYQLAFLIAPKAYGIIKRYYPSPMSEEEKRKFISQTKWIAEGDWWKDEQYPHPPDEVYLQFLNDVLTLPLLEI